MAKLKLKKLPKDNSKFSKQRADLRETLMTAIKLGNLSIMPPMNDGSKKPFTDTWKEYQTQKASKKELSGWYDKGLTGFGLICGHISGNLECLDFDERAIFKKFCKRMRVAGLSGLLKRLKRGYMEHTPNGRHFLYRCSEVSGSKKLATRPKLPEEMKHEKDLTKTLIETRGEGGFIICAPSYGKVNTDGEYKLVQGSLSDIPEITPSEREDLFSVAQTFQIDLTEKVTAVKTQIHQKTSKDAGRPGDDFNERATWSEILDPHGWSTVKESGGVIYLRRPGKNEGISATVNYQGNDLFHCFTSSTQFEQRSYDKFGAYAVLNHNGDIVAAARQLSQEGYGSAGNTLSDEQFVNTVSCPILHKDALPGWIGEFVDLACAHSEAHAAAILITLLLRFAAEIPEPYVNIGDAKQHARTNAVIVGQSAKARKGTSSKPVDRLFSGLDNGSKCSPGPLSSGEGLINAVRDATLEFDKKVGDYVVTDPGVADKRLFILEEEFAAALTCTKREGNTLSAIIRGFFDSGNAEPLTKSNKIKATGAHVVIVAHITKADLSSLLNGVQIANGFANRFLWVLVHRTQLLAMPEPMPSKAIKKYQEIVASSIEAARKLGTVKMSDKAKRLWEELYPTLTMDYSGAAGSIVSRSEVHTIRLALIYAMAAGHKKLMTADLKAAYALVAYSRESVFEVFKGASGDKRKEKIIEALRNAHDKKLSMSDIHKVFKNNISATEIDKMLHDLESSKLIELEKEKSKGKPKKIVKLAKVVNT